ncbi:MAG: transglutaminase family protein [Methylobacteriaceae bacterium]|nr:transglutaminase family protein [Methylobacteriaceae bacterium]
MRLRLRHVLTCRYRPTANGVIGVLRLTPRSHYGQHVIDWSIDVGVDCRLRQSEDAFGNITHGFQVTGPVEQLRIEATGEVELFDATGFVRDAIERFPEEFYLRDTPATAADAALRAFAAEVAAGAETSLARMHALMGAVRETIAHDPGLKPAAGAAEAFAARRGAASDLAQVFIAAARHLGVPARYAVGVALDAAQPGPEGHGWAEAHVEGYGWIGFDPALNLCPCGRHLRLAMGLDLLAARPMRSARGGFGEEEIVAVTTVTGAAQSQRQ